MKTNLFIVLIVFSLQVFATDNYVADQIKNLSASNPKVRVDAAWRLDAYFTSNGSAVNHEEVDIYINELSKSLQDHESVVVVFISNIMGARMLTDKNTSQGYYYLNRTSPKNRESILKIMLNNLESKVIGISTQAATVLINSTQCKYEMQIRNRIALTTSNRFQFKNQEKKLDALCNSSL
ncbi:MAG: hypothetical protein GY928_04145 [Colwellia sp.]|nr:hypothetical protein [Colwellia sp.]